MRPQVRITLMVVGDMYFPLFLKVLPVRFLVSINIFH